MKIRAGDGGEELGFPEMMSTPLFYLAQKGDRLRLVNNAYKFNVATYLPQIKPRWIYTYDYARDESWTVYRHDLNGNNYRQSDYVFDESVYFRISLRKLDGSLFDASEDINAILAFEISDSIPAEAKPWLEAEVLHAAKQIAALRSKDELVFVLLTDSHYTVNGTWDDTASAIQQMHKVVHFDGVIHLGDFTDGMVSGEVTRNYVNKTLGDLKSCGVPVWASLGNHDSNYFRRNPERFTIKEQCELYLERSDPRYRVDFEKYKLRLIFLDSFDPSEELPYGYSQECISWLAQTLENTRADWRVILFSHLPPVTRLQYWAKVLRGEDEIVRLMSAHSGKILAWINGHNHADKLDSCECVPIISIANAKCEAFTKYKPKGFVTPERKLGDVSQELWDILLINPEKRTLRFVRFGAGRDRIVKGGKAEWL